MSQMIESLQLVPEVNPNELRAVQKAAAAVTSLGFLLLLVANLGGGSVLGWLGLTAVIGGGLTYILDMRHDGPPGIKNNHIMFGQATARGAFAWGLAVFLTGFYVILYFFPTWLAGLIKMVDPVKVWLSGESAGEIGAGDQWFLYGFLYTIAILIMGARALIKYRHSKYHLLRTGSVMFFQLAFAFTIPNVLLKLNQPYFEWTNIWPLRYYELYPWSVKGLIENGTVGWFMLFWGLFSILVATPVLTYFFGKRWYCSWVCGCGGLAETLGDPFRQNSDKSLRAWKIERWSIHLVLVFIVVTTAALWAGQVFYLGGVQDKLSSAYGFLIGAIFSGVIGTGFYPIMGSRVWCRFGCPMAAVLGILQRYYSRFRITTNGGQCISCGNCSTYCEMGIDVRAYAQRGENIVRASCVGCGVCSAVCPRGVLNLENGPVEGRFSV